MILRAAVAVATLCCATAVQAQGPLDGRWAWDPEACLVQPGASDNVPLVIEGNELIFYESSCTIINWSPIGTAEAAWNVSMTCAGEGETWQEESILAVDRDFDGNPIQLIQLDTASGTVVARTYCGE